MASVGKTIGGVDGVVSIAAELTPLSMILDSGKDEHSLPWETRSAAAELIRLGRVTFLGGGCGLVLFDGVGYSDTCVEKLKLIAALSKKLAGQEVRWYYKEDGECAYQIFPNNWTPDKEW